MICILHYYRNAPPIESTNTLNDIQAMMRGEAIEASSSRSPLNYSSSAAVMDDHHHHHHHRRDEFGDIGDADYYHDLSKNNNRHDIDGGDGYDSDKADNGHGSSGDEYWGGQSDEGGGIL